MKWGYIYGLVAYLCWGLVPLYFDAVKEVPAKEILAHRIVWSVGLLAGLTLYTGNWRRFVAALRDRGLVFTMLLSGSLLALNWYLYIFATTEKRVGEAALGYYMMPLVNAFLATLILKEKLRPAHYPALLLIAVGVSIPLIAKNEFTWLAVALPITFGCYGLVRKMTTIDTLTGLSVESLLLAIPSVSYLIWLGYQHEGHFGTTPRISMLLAFGGLVTVIPLVTYILCIRRLPLLTLSFIQFLSPTMQLIVSYWVLGEPIGSERWAAIGCVWLAVAIFIVDAVMQARSKPKIVVESELVVLPQGDAVRILHR